MDDGVIVTPGGAKVESPLAYTGLLPSANGVTLVHGRTTGSREDSIYQVLGTADGSLRLLTDAGFDPAISADDRFVAWQVAESNGSILATGNGPYSVVGRVGPANHFATTARIGAPDGSFSADDRSVAYVDRYGNLKVRDLTSGGCGASHRPPGVGSGQSRGRTRPTCCS